MISTVTLEEQDFEFARGMMETAPYTAGILDGEGCIDIQRQKAGQRGHFARIGIVNTHKSLLDWLKDAFGGDVQPASRAKKKWKQSFRWRLSGSAAEVFLILVLPWLIVKKQQALLALQVSTTKEYESIRRKIGAYRRLTTTSLLAGESLRLQLKHLNRKGAPV